jgi:hypothetical protein
MAIGTWKGAALTSLLPLLSFGCADLPEDEPAGEDGADEPVEVRAQALGSVMLFDAQFSAGPLPPELTPSGNVRVASGRLELRGSASVELSLQVGAHEQIALDYRRAGPAGGSLRVEWRSDGAWLSLEEANGDTVYRTKRYVLSGEADGRPLRIRIVSSAPSTAVSKLDSLQMSGEPRPAYDGRVANYGYQRFAVEHQCGWGACCGSTAADVSGWYPGYTFQQPEVAPFDGRIWRLSDNRYRVILHNDAGGGACCFASTAAARAAYPHMRLARESEVTAYDGTIRVRADRRYEILYNDGRVECCYASDGDAQAAHPGKVFKLPRAVPRFDAEITESSPSWYGVAAVEGGGMCCQSVLSDVVESYGMHTLRMPGTPDPLDLDNGCRTADPSRTFRGSLWLPTYEDLTAYASVECVSGSLGIELGDTRTDLTALAGLREVRGGVSVYGSWGSSSTRLSGLGLARAGSLYVSVPGLETLDGLENLTWVGGRIDIYDGVALSLAPFSSLEHVGSGITVQGADPAELDALVTRVGAPSCN